MKEYIESTFEDIQRSRDTSFRPGIIHIESLGLQQLQQTESSGSSGLELYDIQRSGGDNGDKDLNIKPPRYLKTPKIKRKQQHRYLHLGF